MLSDYADQQYRESAKPFIGPLRQGENRLDIHKDRPKFKFFGGVYRLSDMELPFLIDLPIRTAVVSVFFLWLPRTLDVVSFLY